MTTIRSRPVASQLIGNLQSGKSYLRFTDMNGSRSEGAAEGAYDTIADTLKALSDGEKIFTVGQTRDIVLVLGNTGAGKSALTMHISDNDINLKSKETRVGSGEFTLEDVWAKKICHSTIKSCTMVPELTMDAATGTAFYDCPGFSDTRSAAFDIAATYFINRLILSADRVKIVCVINYSSVRPGVDRKDFQLLMKNIVTMIPDIKKFADSLSLVVTKVDNGYVLHNGVPELIKDEVIIGNVAHFLTQTKAELARGTISLSDQLSSQSAIHFIDILLTKQDSTYSRIGLFRRPQKSGLLSNIPDFQKSKLFLRKMILENMKYASFTPQDFKYVVSDEWKVQLKDLLEEFSRLLASDFKVIGEQFGIAHRQRLRTTLQQQVNLDDIISDISSAYENFIALKNSPLDVEKLIIKIVENCQKSKISIPGKYITNVTHLGQYTRFISSISGVQMSNLPSLTSIVTGPIFEYLTREQRWYSFCSHLLSALEGYDMQKSVELITTDTEQLVSQIRVHAAQRRLFDESLQAIVHRASSVSLNKELLESYIKVKHMNLEKEKLTVLENIVRFYLRTPMTFITEGDRKTLQGYHLRAKDINTLLNSCEPNIKFVQVYSVSKIVFDEDVDTLGKNLQLSIIAPTWEIIGERWIKMDGSPGPSWTKAGALESAPGSNGRNGEAGKPGGRGGGFFGIGEQCLRCNHLSISAHGGRGGDGQDGGDGVDGEHGERLETPTGKGNATCEGNTGDAIAKIAATTLGSIFSLGFAAPTLLKEVRYEVICSLQGKEGQEGGIAGQGGSGAKGGHRGNIVVFLQPSHPSISANDGRQGLDGSQGRRGKDGALGRKLKYTLVHNADMEIRLLKDSVRFHELSSRIPHSAWVDRSIHSPENPQPAMSLTGLPLIVNRYKVFARERLQPTRYSNLMQFLEHLETSTNITGLYDTLGLVNDLQSLESQFYSHQITTPILKWYIHLLSRIGKYASNRTDAEKNDEYKRVLGYLYTSTLSKICSIDSPWISTSDWVINVEGFLEYAMKEIQELRIFKSAVEKNRIAAEYQQGISNKIVEALSFIDQDIMPTLEKSISENELNIHKIVSETLSRQETAKQEGEALRKNREELQNQLVAKSIMGGFRMAGLLVKFLGPAAQLVGSVVESAAIFGGAIVDHPPGDVTITALPEGVKFTLEKMREKFNEEKLFFKEQLHDMDRSFGSYLTQKVPQNTRKILGEVKSLISRTITKMQNQTQDKNNAFMQGSSDNVDKDRKLLKAALEKAEFQLKQLLPKDSRTKRAAAAPGAEASDVKKALAPVDYSKHIVDIGVAGKDIYNQVKGSLDAIAKVDKSIEEAKQNLDNLREYERAIETIVRPLCEGIYGKILRIGKTTVDKSQAALVVQEWKVQSALREVQAQLGAMTQGFKAQGPLIECMKNMSFAIEAMIKLYDRIQSYHNEVALAAYTAALSSNSYDLPVRSTDLKNAIDELKLTIQSNLVLSEYELAKNSVSQYVFPFSRKFLQQFTLPPQLKPGMDKEKFISDVVNQIRVVGTAIKRNKHVLASGQDENSFLQMEFHQGGDLAPFFTWKHEHYGDTITRLLSGQQVVLLADIRKGVNKNAIKFDGIGLQFQFYDEQVQRDFVEVAKEFSVSMLHLGDSYYRCGEKFYVLDHTPQKITHSLLGDIGGKYTRANSLYMKIQGHPLFSPYTAWKFQLLPGTGELKMLHKFRFQEADVDLVGRGQFVSHEIDSVVCDDKLADFYTLSEGIVVENQELDTWGQSISLRPKRSTDYFPDQAMNESGIAWSSTKGKRSTVLSSMLRFLGLSHDVMPIQLERPAAREPLGLHSWPIKDTELQHDSAKFLKISGHNQESPVSDVINNTLNVQSNLVLADYLLRRYVGSSQQASTRQQNEEERNRANDMAYRGYAPHDKKDP